MKLWVWVLADGLGQPASALELGFIKFILRCLGHSSILGQIEDLNSQFSSVQLLSWVQLFATPWAAGGQASLSITNSWGLLKPMSIELVMPSNRLILCCPLLLLPSIFLSMCLSQRVSSSHQLAKVLAFQLQHQSFQ